MPEPKTHAQNRNWMEQLLRHIPGFRGYLEKSYRRESDALQRQFLADRLQRSKHGLDTYSRQLVDQGKLDQLGQCDRLRAKLDKLISRIRGAMQGYSGIFDLVHINESLLDRVYEHDMSLVQRVETLAEGIEKLASATVGPTEALPALVTQVTDIEQAWDHRTDILRGLE